MLLSKLRVVFENASSEVELWNKATSAQVDSQLRERRRSFRRRRESLERVQAAAGDLEFRLIEIETHDARLQGFLRQTHELLEAMREQACAGPQGGIDLISLQLAQPAEDAPLMLRRAQA
jgi:vacuolar-type H+-ATPase subunit E/Vma4